MDNAAYENDLGDGEKGKSHDADIKKGSSVDVTSPGASKQQDVDNKNEARVDVTVAPVATKPYSGMGKEDLLRFSNTPFWNNLRLACVIIFWLGWCALVAAVVVLTVNADRCSSAPTTEWWQTSNFYQVFVESFYDSNSDGNGDLTGIKNQLKHFEDQTANGIILSSIYSSDSESYSYAVTNHTQLDPKYGNETDFMDIISGAHDAGIRVLVEFIPNHVSIEHPWFANRQTPKFQDYFVWADCSAGPPNNWLALYGGSAWHPDPDTIDTCYLGQISRDHPDLNLRSEAVKGELETILHYWLSMGVDGFKVNMAHLLYEDYDLTNDTLTCQEDVYSCSAHDYTWHQPDNIALIARWRDVVESHNSEGLGAKILIADVRGDANQTVRYFGTSNIKAAHMVFSYDLINRINSSCDGSCVQSILESIIVDSQIAVSNPTFSWITSSQDDPRLSTKKGVDYTKVLNVLRMTLPGVGFTYYGEDIGMLEGEISGANCLDQWYLNTSIYCRDNSRTPMAWNATGGFSNTAPWIDYSPGFNTSNVQGQSGTTGSVLDQLKQLSLLHNDSATFHYGHFRFLSLDNSAALAYVRNYEGVDWYLIALNFANLTITINLDNQPDVPGTATVVLDTGGVKSNGDEQDMGVVTLGPGQGAVYTWPYKR